MALSAYLATIILNGNILKQNKTKQKNIRWKQLKGFENVTPSEILIIYQDERIKHNEESSKGRGSQHFSAPKKNFDIGYCPPCSTHASSVLSVKDTLWCQFFIYKVENEELDRASHLLPAKQVPNAPICHLNALWVGFLELRLHFSVVTTISIVNYSPKQVYKSLPNS